jgi:glutathione S-transferase/3-isopropylmalate dehydratase
MGVPYEAERCALGQPTPGILEASPLGKLPAIKDGDVAMVESVAIMQYVMAKHGPTPLAVKPEEQDFPYYLQFLEFGEAGLCAIGNALVATKFRAPDNEKVNWTSNYVRDEMAARLKLVHQRVQGRAYLAAGRFTAADISVGYGLGL